MTNLFIKVFSGIARKNDWYCKHHDGRLYDFYQDCSDGAGNRIISVNNNNPDFSRIKMPYRGTHVVRDPRDLLISGYRYHKWCAESWTKVAMDDEFIRRIRVHEYLNRDEYEGKSYQELLNSIDQELGILIELNWRYLHFVEMYNWNYENPDILELKYENIFNSEEESFSEICTFYGFDQKLTDQAVSFARDLSFRNQKKSGATGNKKHLSIGHSGQWRNHLGDRVEKIFNEHHSGLIKKLDYAPD